MSTMSATLAQLLDERRQRNAAIIAKLPPFDVYEALKGKPYVWIYGPTEQFSDVRIIHEPHPGWLVWIGEWVVYDDEDLMCHDLRMAEVIQ